MLIRYHFSFSKLASFQAPLLTFSCSPCQAHFCLKVLQLLFSLFESLLSQRVAWLNPLLWALRSLLITVSSTEAIYITHNHSLFFQPALYFPYHESLIIILHIYRFYLFICINSSKLHEGRDFVLFILLFSGPKAIPSS